MDAQFKLVTRDPIEHDSYTSSTVKPKNMTSRS